jgi:hypothetical protein
MNLTYLDFTDQIELAGTIPTEMYVTAPATLVRWSELARPHCLMCIRVASQRSSTSVDEALLE